MNADLHRLAVFHAIAVEGGITAAAKRLGKSPPAVHHSVKRLQTEIGRPLFERAGRRLRLTPEGRVFHQEVMRALASIERALRQVRSADAAAVPLRIAAVSGFGRFRLMPRLLAATPKQRPIEILLASHETVLGALTRQDVDLAITYRPVVSAPMQVEHVADEEIVLVTPRAWRRPTSAGALADAVFITYDEYEYVFGCWFKAVLGRQPHRLGRLDHTSELDEAMTCVAAGRGLTIAPRDAWEAGPWREHTRLDVIDDRRCVNALYLVGLGERLESEDAKLLRDILDAAPKRVRKRRVETHGESGPQRRA